MKYRITYTPAEPRAVDLGRVEPYPETTHFDVSDVAKLEVRTKGDGFRLFAVDAEPEPIPMADMQPGQWAVVVSPLEFAGRRCYRDSYDSDVIDMDEPSQAWRSDGNTINTITVRLILKEPGDTLTITAEDEPVGSVTTRNVQKAREAVAALQDEPEKPQAPNEPPGTRGSESAPRLCHHCKHCSANPLSPPCSDDCYDTDGHKHFQCVDTDEARAANPEPQAAPDDQFERTPDGLVVGSKTWQGQECDDCTLVGEYDNPGETCKSCNADWRQQRGLGPAEPDDLFERLGDRLGERKACAICAVRYSKDQCRDGGPSSLPFDERGIDGRAHPCFREALDIEPTLAQALQLDAEAIMAAAERAEDCGGDALWELCTAIVEARMPSWRVHLDGAIELNTAILDVHVGVADLCDTMRSYHKAEDEQPAHAVLARAFVALRDRLGLRFEVNDESV